jgi:lambda family phage portal protein
VSLASVFVPREDVHHIFEAVSASQQRVASWFTPALTAIHSFDALLDACIETAKTKALFTGFVKNIDGSGAVGADLAELQPMMPGSLVELPIGCDVTFNDPGDMSSLDAVVRASARQICAAMGVPYEPIFDLSQTNYSSNKAGFESFKRRVRVIRNMLVAQFLQPVWEKWVAIEILSGRLRAPDYARDPRVYNNVAFLWSEWASLDPYREAQANATLLQIGVKSRQQIITEGGRDVEQVDAELASDQFVPTAKPSNVTPITSTSEAA